MRRIAVVFAALALSALSAQADSDKIISRTFDVGQGGTIHLDADAGDVHVTSGGSRSVTVEVIRHERADQNELTFDQKGNDVFVRSRDEERAHGRHWSFSWSDSDWITFNIRIPSRYGVDLHTSGGSITADDIDGNAELHSSGGALKTGRVNGNLIARSSGGDIKSEGANGTVDLRTSGGSIEIRHAGGTAVVHTSGGNIHIEDALDTVNATTSGGSITARFSRQPRGDSRLSTSGGGVTVELAPSIGAELDAQASGGGVHSDMPITIQGTRDNDSLVGRIGGGGPRLVLRTSGGGIHIRREY